MQPASLVIELPNKEEGEPWRPVWRVFGARQAIENGKWGIARGQTFLPDSDFIDFIDFIDLVGRRQYGQGAIPKSWLLECGALPHRTRCPGVRSFSSVRCPALQRRGNRIRVGHRFHLLLAMNCQVAAGRRTELKFRTPGHLRCGNTTAVRPSLSSPPGNELPGCRGAADGTEVPYSGAPAVQEDDAVRPSLSSPPGNELPGCRRSGGRN
jgi:hypothetical protein